MLPLLMRAIQTKRMKNKKRAVFELLKERYIYFCQERI